jgi:sugar phosphate isomerase/epimerase
MANLDRRSFFQTATTAALAGTLLGSTARAAEAGKRKFTMDLRCGSIGVRADLREAVRLAGKFGFESVAPAEGELARISQTELEELLGLLKETHLVWGGAGMPVNFRADDDKFKADLAQLPEGAKALKRAGVSRASTWLSPSSNSLTYAANFRQHAVRLREIGKIYADAGIRFGLEYVGPKTSWTSGRYPFVHSMAEAKELIAEIGCPNVGLVLDSWHWYTAEETEADLLSLSGEDVVACDLNDAPAGIEVHQQMDLTRDLPCATGVIDLKTFLGALVEIGYDGPIRAEPFKKELQGLPAEEAVAQTAAAMKRAFALVD